MRRRRRGGCLGCVVALSPGSYLLRFDDATAPVEQTIVASEGWQTQVFLAAHRTTDKWTLDLSDGAILMSGLEQGFVGEAAEFRWTEAARQTLSARRGTATPVATLKDRTETATNLKQAYAADPEQLHRMFRAKFRNPMLGIYAAHMMLLQDPPDLDAAARSHREPAHPHRRPPGPDVAPALSQAPRRTASCFPIRPC